MNEEHIGSNLDSFLKEEGLLEEAKTVATKRVLAYQVEKAMKQQKLSKSEMARRMKTSRSLQRQQRTDIVVAVSRSPTSV